MSAKTESVKQPDNSKPSKPRKASTKSRKATSGSWRPGVSGNPRGRPRSGNSLAEVFRVYLNEKAPVPGSPKRQWRTRQEILAARLFDMAISPMGCVAAVRLFCDVVGTFEVEVRLQELESKVSVVLEEAHRGRLN